MPLTTKPTAHTLHYVKAEAEGCAVLKIKAAFAYVSLPLETKTCSDSDALAASGKGIYLTCAPSALTSTPATIGQSSAILRYVSSLSPYSNLYGTGSNYDKALVDQWLDFCRSEFDVPNAALKQAGEPPADLVKQVKDDITKSLTIVDTHLTSSTYLTCNYITCADISLACSLKSISPESIPDSLVNLKRWFNTVINHPTMSSLCGGSSSSSSPSSSSPSSSSPSSSSSSTQNIDLGLQMSGVPPPVAPKLYKRNRLRIKELLSSPPMGSTVTVCGWARTIRNADAGKLLFIELNDGSTTLSVQCVLKESTTGFEESKSTKSGGTGASFEIVGEVIQSEGAGQAIEILVIKSTLLGAVYGGDAEGKTVGGAKYPLSKKGHTLEHLREHAHLRPRSKVHSAAMRVRHAMAFATHKFFNDNGFLYVHTPIITCADCEGAGEQFGVTTMFGVDPHKTDVKVPYVEPEKEEKKEEAAGADGEPKKGLSNKAKKKAEKKAAALAKKAALQLAEGGKPPEEKLPIGAVDYTKDFFAKRANLTVSGQLNVETHCCAMSDVYTFGPTFRAENSHTSRHLAEFWMIEPEIAFADLHDDINLAEDYIKYCVTYALEVCKDDLEFFETSPFGEKGLIERLKNVIAAPFKRLTYTEGIKVLQKVVEDGHKFEESKIEWGMDLGSEHERYLCETVFKKPVVLTDYPKDIKAFYMKLNEDGKTVAAADILVPKIGELVGGSQREHRADTLHERCVQSGVDPKAVWWYMELRKFGTIPHAGFGLGFERLILFITGLENIRDVIPFPRAPGLADF